MRSLQFLLFLLSFSLTAQDNTIFDYEIQDVTKEELKEAYHPLDSSAPAATLFKIGHLTMRYNNGWVYQLEVQKRIKIYNKEGYEFATIAIPYYYGVSNDTREKIKKVRAHVYNLDGNKIKEDNLKGRDVVDEQVSELWKQKKFTFPNISPGSIIEYSYIYESPNINDLQEWMFQDEIPVNYSRYQMVIPEYFGYRERSKGFHQIRKTSEYVTYEMSFRFEGASDSYGIGTSLNTETGVSSVNAVKHIYAAEDIPKLKDEPFVNNSDNFLSSIKHEMSYYKNLSTNAVKEFTTTWQEVALSLQNSERFGYELDRTNYFEEDIDQIIANSVNDDEILFNILNHVKSHMTWNDYLGIYSSDKLNRAYKDKTGNIASINLMLTSMLRYAGFNAHPVLISTIQNGIPGRLPSTTDFNYLISAVEFGEGKHILLDASNAFTAPDLLPTFCLNWTGRLVRPNGTSKDVNLNPSELSKDYFIMNLNINQEGKVEGQLRRQYTEQYAFQYRVNFSSADRDDYINSMENNLGINISSYKSDNIEELTKPVVETLSFSQENAIDVINDNLYISPLLFLAQDQNPFKQETKERKLPINFTFPKSKRYIVNLKVPEGYEIDYMPESVAIGLPNEKGLYKFDIKKSPTGDIQIVILKRLTESIVGPQYYQPLKDFYKTIVEKETDKIVLKKI